MKYRFGIAAFTLAAFAFQLQAQPPRKRPAGPELPPAIQASNAFRALFKPAIEKPARSTVRVQVDGEDSALGTIVSSEGYILTKASEIEGGAISVKTSDGRHLDGKLVSVSDDFDLALVKVEGTGLTPIDWTSSAEAIVGNWVAVPGANKEAVAVGVISTGAWVPRTGFLGVRLAQGVPNAKISEVLAGGAAEKAGMKANDVVVKIGKTDIATGDALIETLQTYQRDDTVAITLLRDGKTVTLNAILGKRMPEPTAPKNKLSRGDRQNNMGSELSSRRTSIPCFLQTDAVIKPVDCGGPLVDVDGRAIGMTLCRAGRTESWALPTESVKSLTAMMLTERAGLSPTKRVEEAKAALKFAEDNKQCADVIAEGKRYLAAATKEEEWWHDRKLEKGPAPKEIDITRGPKPRIVSK